MISILKGFPPSNQTSGFGHFPYLTVAELADFFKMQQKWEAKDKEHIERLEAAKKQILGEE